MNKKKTKQKTIVNRYINTHIMMHTEYGSAFIF